MIRNIYINGKVSTMLVMEEGTSLDSSHLLIEALKNQAERIDLLERQNQELLKQESILLNLLEASAATGNIMAKSLQILQTMEESIDPDFQGNPDADGNGDDYHSNDS